MTIDKEDPWGEGSNSPLEDIKEASRLAGLPMRSYLKVCSVCLVAYYVRPGWATGCPSCAAGCRRTMQPGEVVKLRPVPNSKACFFRCVGCARPWCARCGAEHKIDMHVPGVLKAMAAEELKVGDFVAIDADGKARKATNAAARNFYCSCGDRVPDYCVRTGDRLYCHAVCAEKSEAYKLGCPVIAVCATDTNAMVEANYQTAVAALNVAHGRTDAVKPTLPAVGSRWKFIGSEFTRYPSNRASWVVTAVINGCVQVDNPDCDGRLTSMLGFWDPREWSPDEEAKPTAYEQVKKLLDEKKLSMWPGPDMSTRVDGSHVGEPPRPLLLPTKPRLSPAEAVERAVREAPSSLHKEALRAALVNVTANCETARMAMMSPTFCEASFGYLSQWLVLTEAERAERPWLTATELGRQYLRALAAIQAPKMGRPARWSQGGVDRGWKPR